MSLTVAGVRVGAGLGDLNVVTITVIAANFQQCELYGSRKVLFLHLACPCEGLYHLLTGSDLDSVVGGCELIQVGHCDRRHWADIKCVS